MHAGGTLTANLKLGLVALVLAGGCGKTAMESATDAGAEHTTGTGGAAGASVASTGGTDGGVDGGAQVVQFGIAVRPAKQTCNAPAAIDQPADRLSATGCVDPTDVKKPAPSLIPYDVASPLWSDGADKQRFLGLPDGSKIHVKNCTTEPATCLPVFQDGTPFDEGHWVLPVGTVLVKNFLFAGKFVETRLFVRFADVWGGFSYQWNKEQTEALLVTDMGATADIINGSGATQKWTFPGRNDCLECHNDTVGNSIGPDTRQFNWSMKYPSGVTANQVDTLEHIGLFDASVVRMPALVDFRLSSASIDDRARSYLHANCATCHRKDGNYSAIDLRFGISLADMKICNLAPNKGNLGIVDSKRLVPATPSKSLMVLRMQAVDKDSGRMPQLATSVLDTLGIDLVTKWIQGITTCP
jgi:uncharacterized repeat protein (TIGR03806 family)